MGTLCLHLSIVGLLTRVRVKVVLVDEYNLRLFAKDMEREWIRVLDFPSVRNRTLPVAVVELRRADQGKEPWRVHLINQSLNHEVDVLGLEVLRVDLLEHVGRQSLQNLGLVGRLLALGCDLA